MKGHLAAWSVLGAVLGLSTVAQAAGAKVTLPPYSHEVLPNGLTLMVMERKGLPLVEIAVAVKGGRESDPVDQGGLAQITADLLRKGTARYTASQFSETLDNLGGEFQVHVDDQSTLIRGEFLAKDLLPGLALVSEAVLHPVFSEEEVHKLLEQQMDTIKEIKDDPRRAVRPYARSFFFGSDHPYGRVMDEMSISRLNRSQIAAYHDRLYSGHNLFVAIVGDVDSHQATMAVREAFAGVPAGNPYVWQKPIVLKTPSQPRLLLVDKPGATQTYFMIIQPGIAAKDPDRVPIALVNTLFGGRFTSMLNEELRIKSGLSYGATNNIDEDRLQGMNSISTYTKTESTAQAISLALKTLVELREKGVTSSQLESAKAYLKGVMPGRTLETSDQLANKILHLEVLGLGREEIDTLFQRIDAVTVEQANAVIYKHFQTTGLTLLVVGDATKIRDQVKPFAPHMRELAITKAGFGS